MKEEAFRAWLRARYGPSTERTYLGDFRRAQRRFSDLHRLCLNGELDEVMLSLQASWQSGVNKSAKAEMQAIRTYVRFLDDDMSETPPSGSPERAVQAGQQPRLAKVAMTVSSEPVGQTTSLTYSGGYWHPEVFPREAFVQKAVERHFVGQGFQQITEGHADWVCIHPHTGQRWHVECKGQTTAVGLDFRTGLGQLIQAMRVDDTCYAMAVPNIPPFLRQIERMDPQWLARLGIQFLLVDTESRVVVHEERIGSFR